MTSETTASDLPPETKELDDPRAMRALAHPVRLAILELLHEEGSANATECARVVGESPQACSYHLRALAKYGFVRQVASDDARETRWTPAAAGFRFGSAAGATPELAAASTLLASRVLERDERILATFLQREPELEEEWRDAAILSSGSIYATPEELRELERRVRETLRPYARPRRDQRPEGARRVHVVLRAVPRLPDGDR